MNNIRVVVANPGERAAIVEIPSTLEALQKVVGGYIEAVQVGPFQRMGLHLYVNEEGLLLGLPFNRFNLVGPILVSKMNAEGDDVGLTEREAIEAVMLLEEAI